ncbi:MAG TPA: nuclear transport factor 2 family protein [bacterium]|nr:nuclear transport factor 2 family protein [bacterium]
MKRSLIVLAVILAAVGLFLGVSRLIVTDEERIEAIVKEVSQAIANEDLAGCMRHVSDDFVYQPKHVNKARLAAHVQQIFARADDLKVTISQLEIDVEGESATITLRFRLLGAYVGRMDQFVGKRGFILGEPLKAARATLHLSKRPRTEAPAGGQAVWMLDRATEFNPGL